MDSFCTTKEAVTPVTVFLYSINIIVMTFTVFLFLLSDSTIFGSNMVFLIVQLPYTNQKYDKTFVLFTLLVTYILNYKNSIDNSTYCGNAIYSIVLFVICLTYGAFYFYTIKEELIYPPPPVSRLRVQQPPLFETIQIPYPFRSYFIYLKFIMILLMDWFYQPYAKDEWYLLSCFVLFIGNTEMLHGRYVIPFFGLVIGNFYRSISQWIWYTVFCVVCSLIDVLVLSKK